MKTRIFETPQQAMSYITELEATNAELLEALKYWFNSKATSKEIAEKARTAIAKAEGTS